MMERGALILFSLLLSLFGAPGCGVQTKHAQFIGNYQISPGKIITIAPFNELGPDVIVFTDFESGRIGLLTPTSENQFTAGPGLLLKSPVEIKITFSKDQEGNVTSFAWEQSGEPARMATKVNLKREDVSFRRGGAVISGTLITPPTKPPHPAIVCLQGSGRSNRNNFGPFPYFFAAQGLAVLVYDKRGVGASTGNFGQATFDDFADDAVAAVQFLKSRKEVDPRKIGLWGVSQGGFLAGMAAARSPDIAFVINTSGMEGPAWEQESYRVEAQVKADGLSANDVAEAKAYMSQVVEVARTGQNWEKLASLQQTEKNKKWFQYADHPSSLGNAIRLWKREWSFNSATALEKVVCPYLAIYGELDTLTPLPQTMANIEAAMKKAGNKDYTIKVFPQANHPMFEAKTGGRGELPRLRRFTPGYWETMAEWLQRRGVTP
jgi:pimeloyl-ACP methyl ester carboxylesterase